MFAGAIEQCWPIVYQSPDGMSGGAPPSAGLRQAPPSIRRGSFLCQTGYSRTRSAYGSFFRLRISLSVARIELRCSMLGTVTLNTGYADGLAEEAASDQTFCIANADFAFGPRAIVYSFQSTHIADAWITSQI